MATDFLAITQHEHFRNVAAILHAASLRGWRQAHPGVPYHTLYNALIKTIEPKGPYQAEDVLTAFVAFQVAIAEADPRLVMPAESVAWLLDRMFSAEGHVTMSLLMAYAAAVWEYATPAEVAAATGTDDSWWRQQAIAGAIPGAIKKGKQWLLPASILKLRGIDVSKLWTQADDDEPKPFTEEVQAELTREHIESDVADQQRTRHEAPSSSKE